MEVAGSARGDADPWTGQGVRRGLPTIWDTFMGCAELDMLECRLTELEGVSRLARGEPHHLATLDEAFNVQEIVEAILAGK